MTAAEFTTDRYHHFMQRVFEVIGRLPDPEDFVMNNPATANDIQKIRDELRVVESDIQKLAAELDDEVRRVSLN